MRILVVSVGPIFREHVHGGSQRILREVCSHLGRCGHEVTVLCTRRPDNSSDFILAPGVTVKPILRFKATYPEPYHTAPFNLSGVIRDIRRAIEQSDVLYLHDGQLAYRFLYRDIPTVISYRDFTYADTLAAAFSFRRDVLIAGSNYLAGCIADAFAPFCPEVASRIVVVRNGVDLTHFRRQLRPDWMRTKLGLKDGQIGILCPHRPEPRKGVRDSLDALALLRKTNPNLFTRLRLLVPIWMDGAVASGSRHVFHTFSSDILRDAEERGLAETILLHPWVSYDEMPAYYCAGGVTLCVGNIVETFGNVHVESIACGTPAIVSRVGAHRSILPDEMVYKVDYGDAFAIASAIEDALTLPPAAEVWREHLASTYDFSTMLEGYERTICATSLRPELPEDFERTPTGDDVIALPTWCAAVDSGIYNDFMYDYDRNHLLSRFVSTFGRQTAVSSALAAGFTEADIMEIVTRGSLVRRRSQ